ncbi:PEP-CTERM/exosortase system-associated acyltransferase [Gammaproteobacteria bacterium]|nr:PEP-CTERM/exosortase system-associated acyltransferase [Gammaproteobacteria bacterium]
MSDIETVVADTDFARRLHYWLRYQVYCLETGFEKASRYPDRLERDEFDCRSKHFLMRDMHSDVWFAAARLVLPSDRTLPVERHCGVPRNIISSVKNIPYEQTAEFSRLLITKKGWPSIENIGLHHPNSENQRFVPRHFKIRKMVALKNLIRSMAAYCCEHKIPQWVFFATPALARILRRLGIKLSKIGGASQHRGVRFPYVAEVEQIYDTLTLSTEHERSKYQISHPYRLFSELHNTKYPSLLEEPFVERFGT